MLTAVRTRIKQGGRLVIPAEYRHQLCLTLDQEVLVSLSEGVLHVAPLRP